MDSKDRHKLLLTMLDAVYVVTREISSMLAIRPNAPFRVVPQGVFKMDPPFTLQVATISTKMAKQGTSLYVTVIVSRMASGGIPRSPSSLRSSRMSAIASARFSRASSFVVP